MSDNTRLTFGKYHGYTFQWVCQNDIQYAIKTKNMIMETSFPTQNMKEFATYVIQYTSQTNASSRLRERQLKQEQDVIFCGKSCAPVSTSPKQDPRDVETYIDYSECSQPPSPSLSGWTAPPPSPALVPSAHLHRIQQPMFYNPTSSSSLFSTGCPSPSSNIFAIRTYGHCYLLQVLAESKTQTPIFKIGRSDDILQRLQSEHYRNARIICVREVNNAASCEREIIETFKRRFRQVTSGRTTSIGTEYFEGNEEDVIRMFDFICSRYAL